MKEVTLHQETIKVAHDLFERSGRVKGHDLDNWLEAKRIVMTRYRHQEFETKMPVNKMILSKKERSGTYCAFMK